MCCRYKISCDLCKTDRSGSLRRDLPSPNFSSSAFLALFRRAAAFSTFDPELFFPRNQHLLHNKPFSPPRVYISVYPIHSNPTYASPTEKREKPNRKRGKETQSNSAIMSSMRNAVQRRNHKERAQPLERQKWGLLEKKKVCSSSTFYSILLVPLLHQDSLLYKSARWNERK
jgi:hypothetical protein